MPGNSESLAQCTTDPGQAEPQPAEGTRRESLDSHHCSLPDDQKAIPDVVRADSHPIPCAISHNSIITTKACGLRRPSPVPRQRVVKFAPSPEFAGESLALRA